MAVLALLATCGLVFADPPPAKNEPARSLSGHQKSVREVAFHPDGKALASSDSEGKAKFWDVATGEVRKTFEASVLSSIGYTPDGKTFAWQVKDGITLLDLPRNQEKLITGRFASFGLGNFAFSPDSKTLATVSPGDKFGEWTFNLWDVGTSKLQTSFKGPNLLFGPKSLVFAPNGRYLAAARIDNKVGLWDIATGKEKASFMVEFSIGTGGPNCIAFSPDGKLFATGGSFVGLWETASGERKALASDHLHSRIYTVAFRPDGKWFASAGKDKNIKLWDVATGKEVATLKAHAADVNCLAFSPDGKVLASGSSDKTIKLWDLTAVKASDK
jgi:WD40 repeat protein